MSIVFEQAVTYESTAGSTSHTINLTVTSTIQPALIFSYGLISAGGSAVAIDAVTIDPGGSDEASFSEVGTVFNVAGIDMTTSMWVLNSTSIPSTGAYTIRADIASSENLAAGVCEYSGVRSTTSPVVSEIKDNGESTYSFTFASTTNGSLIFSAACADTIFPGQTHYANGTERFDNQKGSVNFAGTEEIRDPAASATISHTASLGSPRWTVVTAEFVDADKGAIRGGIQLIV